ncbi:MAG: TadE/TadG family type IV pilus assembly protein, partial [Anaerolineae bacterium]
MDEKHRLRAQGMVEFALILPGLLMMVLSIIEGALLFQSYLAIQHAAREAARYAVTYQPPITYSQAQGELMLDGYAPGVPAYPTETEAQWYDRRVALIKQRALDQAMGIRILHPALTEAGFSALQSMPGFFGVRVQGFPAHDSDPVYDNPSLPGLPVRVEVHYRWQPLDPLIGAMWPSGVPLVGEAIMVNEGVQVGLGAVAPPQFPPPEALDPPTATYTPEAGGPTATATTESTATATPTLTPTPTATPGYPYIVLEPSHAPWTEEELPGGEVVVYNHLPETTYSVSWTRSYCPGETPVPVGLDLTTSTSGWAANAMPSGFDYLTDCGGVPLEMDRTYTCTLSTSAASVAVPVYVPRRRPDLVVSQVILPEDMVGGGTFVIGIEIENTQDVAVSGTFDVDIYIDPNHTPVLAGQPGLGTTGGSSPKQWMADMAPNSTQILNYVIQLPPYGSHELWAQVDTSDYIDEVD